MKDYFNKDASRLKNTKLWLFDMDGTIYNDNTLFDGALDLFDLIVKNGGRYIFLTNNSSKSVTDYLTKVRNLGITANEDNFYTSSQACIKTLLEKHPNQKIYCQGTKSFIKELKDNNINVTTKYEDDIDVVVIGFDLELTSEKLNTTCEVLTKLDVPYYATNPDLVCPVSFGYVPDCGSISIMIKNATGKYPIFLGKPESTMIDIVRNKYNMRKDQTVVIGDRLYTDIKSGVNAGVITILVLSGEATLEDYGDSDFKPDFVFKSIKDLLSD